MTDYWCDYKNGSDAGTGATGDPWKTITYALTQMSASDVLKVRGSSADDEIYQEGVTVSLSVTIEADSGHSPIITRATQILTTSFSKTAGQTNVYEASNTSGNSFRAWHGSTRLDRVADVATCDSTTNSAYSDGSDIYVNVGGSAPTSAVYAFGTWDYPVILSSSATWDGIDIQWVGRGISITGANATAQNCTVQYTGLGTSWNTFQIINVAASGATINNCTLKGPNLTTNEELYGITLGSGATSTTIENCTIGGTNGAMKRGIDISTNSLTGNVVDNCDISECLDGIYAAATGGDVTVKNSSIYDCWHGLITNNSGTIATTIHHNLFYFTKDQLGTRGEHGIIYHTSGTQLVYHNVFAHLDKSNSGSSEGLYFAPSSGTLTITVKNNAFHSCDRGMHEESGTVTYDLDYNGFYNNGTNFNNIGAGDQGSNNVTTDPSFVDVENYDFELTSGSDYVDAGVAVSGINDGYSGTAPDIGYLEYEGTALPVIMHHRQQQGMS